MKSETIEAAIRALEEERDQIEQAIATLRALVSTPPP